MGMAVGTAQFLLQDGVLMQHALGRGQHALALGREPSKSTIPLDNHNPKFGLQRAQCV
jgi:hypothetical protein